MPLGAVLWSIIYYYHIGPKHPGKSTRGNAGINLGQKDFRDLPALSLQVLTERISQLIPDMTIIIKPAPIRSVFLAQSQQWRSVCLFLFGCLAAPEKSPGEIIRSINRRKAAAPEKIRKGRGGGKRFLGR